jgi:hypothetical protein
LIIIIIYATIVLIDKGEIMYFYKITTKENVVTEGLSSDREVLDYLINKKINSSGIKGKVEIFEGKKKIDEYDI